MEAEASTRVAYVQQEADVRVSAMERKGKERLQAAKCLARLNASKFHVKELDEAKAAFEALSVSTHLYGRRMVIEWASDDSSIEAMQSKTRQAYNAAPKLHSKRIKLDESLE